MRIKLNHIIKPVVVSAILAITSSCFAVSDLFLTAQNGIQRFDGTTGASLGFISGAPYGSSVASVTYGPDGKLYAISGGTVVRYNPQTGAYIDTFITSVNASHKLVFGPDGDLYACNYYGSTVTRYDGTTGASKGTFITLSGVMGIDFDASGNVYAAGHVPSSINQYTSSGAHLRNLSYGGADLTDIAIAPNGDIYACGFYSSSVARYDGVSGAHLGSFSVGNPYGLTFGPDGNLYITSNATATIKRYNVTTKVVDTFASFVSGGGYASGYLTFAEPSMQPIPEPMSMVLLGISIAGMLIRKKNNL